MLGLKLPTDPRWVNLAEKSLEEVLNDHAFCEQKAASTCISLIQTFPDREQLVEELTPIVTEEWGHFRLVMEELKRRKLQLGKQRKDEYVNQLLGFRRQGGTSRDEVLLDQLLMAALIEARSCERFRLLSEGLEEERMRNFYREFMISEAGHYRLFLDLAITYCGKERVKVRWQQWLDFEAGVMRELEITGNRIH